MPPNVTASCTTRARFVRRIDSRMVALSSGWTVRRSMTSTSVPSLASSPAAIIASGTMRPSAMTVASRPEGGRLAERDLVDLLGHRALGAEHPLVQHHDDRVVVADRRHHQALD